MTTVAYGLGSNGRDPLTYRAAGCAATKENLMTSAGGNNESRRPFLPVAVFTLCYLMPATVFAGVRGNHEFLLYIAVLFVLGGVVWELHRRINLAQVSLWALSIWGLAHMLGGLLPVPENWPINGEIRVLYSLWLVPGYLKYDQVVHAFGFGVTTWVCWQGLKAAFVSRGVVVRPTLGLLTLAAAAGMGFGAMNEVVEFAATLLVPETNVGGYLNTGWDLVSNLVGVVVAAVLIYFCERSK